MNQKTKEMPFSGDRKRRTISAGEADLVQEVFFIFFETFVFNIDNPNIADPQGAPTPDRLFY
ncbi:hypothetical protein [Arsenicibacter rosenii]|uniref:hypothetical protein n=1 Tax=Arsenicibacter rosenii TaxID=1750698 RepID=UPI00116091E4|nr:hypothetical protein [Arsenicibacter rosenii]